MGTVAKTVVYTVPTVSDPYCAVKYEIMVYDNITLSNLVYTNVGRFGSDASTLACHIDTICRTESYLLQNSSAPTAIGTQEINIFTTTTNYMQLNDFVKTITDDYYLYSVSMIASIDPSELSGSGLASVTSTFTLSL